MDAVFRARFTHRSSILLLKTYLDVEVRPLHKTCVQFDNLVYARFTFEIERSRRALEEFRFDTVSDNVERSE